MHLNWFPGRPDRNLHLLQFSGDGKRDALPIIQGGFDLSMPDQIIEAALPLSSLAFGGACWNFLPFSHEATTIQRPPGTHKNTRINALLPTVNQLVPRLTGNNNYVYLVVIRGSEWLIVFGPLIDTLADYLNFRA